VSRAAVATLVALAGCGEVQGFGGDVPPLATVRFQVTGDFESVRVPDATDEALSVAVVWGAQWLPEPLCFLPPESAEVAAVVAAGCRDPLGFVPDRVGESVPAAPNVPGEISLYALPAADVLVGDVTSRIAYAGLVLFDDRDGTGTLDLERGRRVPDPDEEPPEVDGLDKDIVYGASFVAMTEPDVRLVLREGGYNELAAFYPRRGCGAPPPGFSIATAGGFSREAAIAAAIAGEIPSQDPATCREQAVADATIEIPLRAPPELRELKCRGRRGDSSVRYQDTPTPTPDFTNRVTACAGVPDFGTGTATGIVQLVVSSRSDEPCRLVSHYLLRGCDNDATCADPEWDLTAAPPAWWPCAVTGAP
jgi:hypothetical protein